MAGKLQESSRNIPSCPLCGVSVGKIDKHLKDLCLARPFPGQSIQKGVCPHCLLEVGVDLLNGHLMLECLSLTVPCPFCDERHRQIHQHLNRHHKDKRSHPAFGSVHKVENPYKSISINQQNDSLKVEEANIPIADESKPKSGNVDFKDDKAENYVLVQKISSLTLKTGVEDYSCDLDAKQAKEADHPHPTNFKPSKNKSKTLIKCQLCGSKVLLSNFDFHVNSKCLARPLPGQSLEPGCCPHCVKRVQADEMSGHLLYACAKLTVSCPFCYRRFRQIRQHLNAMHRDKSHLPEFLITTKIPNPFKILRGDCLNVSEPFSPTQNVSKPTAFGEDSSDSETEIVYESFLIKPPKI